MIEGDLARRLALTSWILLLAGPLFTQGVDPAPTAQRVIEEIIVTSRRRDARGIPADNQHRAR